MPRPRRRASTRTLQAATVAAVVFGVVSCAGSGGNPPLPRSSRPSILLVTIDTWRWDHLGASGSGKVATPNLDALAARGLYVPKVQSTCPLTTPAHASILTGLLPREHGIRDNQHFTLAPGVATLGERLQREGYRTGAVISGAPLRRAYGLDRGFDAYDDSGLGTEGDNAFSPHTRPANEATDRSMTWLASQPGASPVFLWVHYYDAHWPYVPPPPFRETYAQSPYSGEIAYVDSELGRLLARLRQDRGRDWIVAVTGDHGEGLGDHGEATHGILLYGSTVDVPLILAGLAEKGTLPFSRRGKRGVSPFPPASLVDVAATLCEAAGIGDPPGTGRSVLQPAEPSRWTAAESAYPALGHGLEPGILLRHGAQVFLDQGTTEVYDLDADPSELSNLAATDAGRAFVATAAAARDRIFGDRMAAELAGGTLLLRGDELDALKGLGYVPTTHGAGRPLRRVDLRTFAAELARFQAARELLSARRFDEALAGYDAFLRAYPDSALAHQERGQVLRSMDRMDDAETAFSTALALDPADAVSSLALGNIALLRNRFDVAERFFKESIRAEDGQAEAHLNLGLLYVYKLKRPAAARPHFVRFLELARDDSEAPAVRRLVDEIDGKTASSRAKTP